MLTVDAQRPNGLRVGAWVAAAKLRVRPPFALKRSEHEDRSIGTAVGSGRRRLSSTGWWRSVAGAADRPVGLFEYDRTDAAAVCVGGCRGS